MTNLITRGATLLGSLALLGCAQLAGPMSEDAAHIGFDSFGRTDARGVATREARRGSGDTGRSSTGIPILTAVPSLDFLSAQVSQGTATTQSNFHEPDATRSPQTKGRLMVYSAAYSVLVSSIEEAVGALLKQTEAAGGYLSRRTDAQLTIRVPAAKYREFIDSIPSYGRVLHESTNAQDITDQHTDLTIRMENAEKSRKRLLALLDKAEKMEDVLKIETALRRLTTEIERMKGQLKLLNDKIAYSTVSVEFQSKAPQVKPKRRRSNSRFGWINRIGIEQDLRRFQP